MVIYLSLKLLTKFAAVVNSDGSVIVYYTNDDGSAADINEKLWPETK